MDNNEMFVDVCAVIIDRYLMLRLRTHLELLYKFTDERGIFSSKLEEVSLANYLSQQLEEKALFLPLKLNKEEVKKVEKKVENKMENQEKKKKEKV